MKILFFTQNLARTGSEVALYNIIQNSNRHDFQMAVAAGSEGELLKQLPPDVPYSIYEDAGSDGLLRRLGRRARQAVAGQTEEWLAKYAREYEGYIWYINSIVQPYVLRQARKFGVQCVVHSHEMEQMLWHLREEELRDLLEYPRLLIACSDAAADVFRQLAYDRPIEVWYEPVGLKNVTSSSAARNEVRNRLGISADTFVWAMAGSIDPNKNALAFLDIAHRLLAKHANVHFLWIGGSGGRAYRSFVEARTALDGLAANVSWVGPRTEDYYDYLNAADGFVLTSLRDSFPLTMIEAAALGKPIASFNSGGVKEFVRPGMGMVIDSFYPGELADAMARVMNGEISVDKNIAQARAREFDAPIQVKRWEEIMRNHFS